MPIRIVSSAAPPVSVGDAVVTGRVQTVVVELPFARFDWSRPTGLVIERAGRRDSLSIVDVTRLAQLSIWVAALAARVRGAGRRTS